MNIMKLPSWLATLAFAAVLALTGCAKKEGTVDTSNLEKAFASADAGAKDAINQVVAAVRNSDYAGALAKLQDLSSKIKLTPEQEQAVKSLMEKIKAAVAGAAANAAEGANKAVGDLQKAIKQ
jgi:hypothetical protein